MSTTWRLIIVSQDREVGYLNFEFDDVVDDIVADLPLQKHILSDWWRIDDSRFDIAKLDFSQLSNNSQHNEESIDLLRCNIAESFGENYLTLKPFEYQFFLSPFANTVT